MSELRKVERPTVLTHRGNTIFSVGTRRYKNFYLKLIVSLKSSESLDFVEKKIMSVGVIKVHFTANNIQKRYPDVPEDTENLSGHCKSNLIRENHARSMNAAVNYDS